MSKHYYSSTYITSYISNSDNLIADIKESIDKDLPVFAPLDRYYWSDKNINSGFYTLLHFPHYILIFRYNDLDSTFKIIEVTKNVSGCYKYVIKYDELLECYNGRLEFLKKTLKFKNISYSL